MEHLDRPWPSVAKIGGRYYWVVYRWPRQDENDLVRITDGFATTREIAADAVAAYFDQTDPGSRAALEEQLSCRWLGHRNRACLETGEMYGASADVRCFARNPNRSFSWARGYSATGHAARSLYRDHHGRKPTPKHTNAQGDLGYLYTFNHWSDADRDTWARHRITKITAKRIFIQYLSRDRQLSLPRDVLEEKGEWYPKGWGTGTKSFHTEEYKQRSEQESAERDGRIRGKILTTEIDILGLFQEFGSQDVLRQFRKLAHEHHPDKGGSPAMFRTLVEARDRALAMCH